MSINAKDRLIFALDVAEVDQATALVNAPVSYTHLTLPTTPYV